jgi:hypothetical protein
MTGNAYDFYTSQVSMTEEQWLFPGQLQNVTKGKTKQQLFQKGKSVIAFAYELEELFNMIGDIDERTKVYSLWNGLRIYSNGTLERQSQSGNCFLG